jgi:hypothetical protein
MAKALLFLKPKFSKSLIHNDCEFFILPGTISAEIFPWSLWLHWHFFSNGKAFPCQTQKGFFLVAESLTGGRLRAV